MRKISGMQKSRQSNLDVKSHFETSLHNDRVDMNVWFRSKWWICINEIGLPNFHLWLPHWIISELDWTNFWGHFTPGCRSKSIFSSNFASNLNSLGKPMLRVTIGLICIIKGLLSAINIKSLPFSPCLAMPWSLLVSSEFIVSCFEPIRSIYT